MPNTTCSTERLITFAWLILCHVVRETTDTAVAFTEFEEIFTSGQAGTSVSNSLVNSVIRFPAPIAFAFLVIRNFILQLGHRSLTTNRFYRWFGSKFSLQCKSSQNQNTEGGKWPEPES